MSPARMSKIEASVRTVMEFNDALNRHDVAGMMQLTSEDTVFENTHPVARRDEVLRQEGGDQIPGGLLPRVAERAH